VNRVIPHENELFRFFECKLTIEKTSQICDVNQKTVKQWDAGHAIPAYYKAIMKTYSGLDLSHLGWDGWQFKAGELISPMGWRFTPDMLDYLAIMHSPEAKPDLLQQIKHKKQKPKRT